MTNTDKVIEALRKLYMSENISGWDFLADETIEALSQAGLEITPKDLGWQDAKDLIAVQCKDEGLWFEAETAPEAYLQQELRKLHAAIEGTDFFGFTLKAAKAEETQT